MTSHNQCQPMNEQLLKFLGLVPQANWRRNMPSVWNEQLRQALSDQFVKIGFGGLLELTDAGRNALITVLEAPTLLALEAREAALKARIEELEAALRFIADGYDNHDVNHVDYRVKVYQVALDVLEPKAQP